MGHHREAGEHGRLHLGIRSVGMAHRADDATTGEHLAQFQGMVQLGCDGPADDIVAVRKNLAGTGQVRDGQIGRILPAALDGIQERAFQMQARHGIRRTALFDLPESVEHLIQVGIRTGQGRRHDRSRAVRKVESGRTVDGRGRSFHEAEAPAPVDVDVHKAGRKIVATRIKNFCIFSQFTDWKDVCDLAILADDSQ